jgi:hypothetical protein
VLLGAALAAKVVAAIFLAPAALMATWVAIKRKQVSTLAAAFLLLALFAVPPYAYAWRKTGNPLFPFANGLFRSPYYPAESFSDPRFTAAISWHTAYDATFRSGLFFEGQGGGAGFQYLVLLIPAAILIRRRRAVLSLAIGGIASIALFAFMPNLRYMYPALPLFSIAIGEILRAWRFAPFVFGALAALNAWFLAAGGWYQKDFVLFRPFEVPAWLEAYAPERLLIDYLNRAAPGEPVAFFSTGAVAGLRGAAFTDSWHTNDYWSAIRSATVPEQVAATLRSYRIHYIVAPVSLESSTTLFERFLREWAEPAGRTAGRMGLFRLRESPVKLEKHPFGPGSYDDLDARIEYNGAWIHDRQFLQAANGSLTYCDVPGASLRLEFTGSAITYVFTKALNRGVAQVFIDGIERARIDMYSRETQWRSQRVFEGLGSGKHVFEVRVLSTKNPASSGTYVDLDDIAVGAEGP